LSTNITMKSQYTVSREKGLITLAPTSKHTQTLLFLHGWGESGDLWVDYFQSKDVLPQGTKIILPTAPMRYTNIYEREGPAWTNLYTLNFSQEDLTLIADLKMVEETNNRFHPILDSEIKLLGDSTKFFMGGFSLGGFASSCIWKSYPKPLGGLILYSSTVGKSIESSPEQEYSPVLWTHGFDDCLVLYRHGEYCNYSLDNKKRKFVHIKRDGLGHAVDTVIQVETKAFLEEILLKPKL